MKYGQYILKRKIENIFIYPFILLGKCFAFLKPLPQQYKIFFFFPFYHTGGAEKVHALITQATGSKDAIIFFTRKSADDTFLNDFKKSNCIVKNISNYTDNKWLYFLNLIYRGIISSYINQQNNKPIVFNGQCNFAYKISPWVKKDIRQFELIHSFNTFSWIRIPFVEYYEKTVMISKVRINNHLQQYKKLNFPDELKDRITYICNGIKLPNTIVEKSIEGELKVLFVGRGTPEKRADLFAAVAAEVHKTNSNIRFIMAGDVERAIPDNLKSHVQLLGNVHDENVLSSLYQESNILAITSSTEGFPMVVMEAMSYGCTIIATPVGDLPIHIQQKNGFITSAIEDEIVVEEMTQHILQLSTNKTFLKAIRKNNIEYAKESFDNELFNKKYQELIIH